MQSFKAARGTLYLAIQHLIQYLAAFIFYAGVARFITQPQVGLWSILAASTAVFTTLTLFGMPVPTQKYVSENCGRGDIGSAASISRLSFTIVALLTLPSLAAVILFSPFLSTVILGKAEYIIPFILILSSSAIVALPLAAIDYTLTYLYTINPITRLILEGIFFLVVYTILLRPFKIVQREELELLEKALPHQLEKILNMLESFIIYGTPT